jgi:dienelactone hydrolase
MFEQRRWPREAWLPISAGLLWLWCAASFGVVGFLFSMVPGCMLLSSGVSTLIYPGDRRIPQFTALGGLLGVPLAIPAIFVAGPLVGFSLILLSAASLVAAGAIAIRQERHPDGVPMPATGLALSAQVAADEALLATVKLAQPIPLAGDHGRVRREVSEARELFGDRGWVQEPAAYHRTPPALTDPLLRRARSRKLAYERLSFESEYEPHPEEPGRDRWLSYHPNRTAHAWVLRHADGRRPWLVCIHGYQMGTPAWDFAAFRAGYLHHRLGLNLVLPVLPLHGPRKIGRVSGDGFLVADFLDTIHAEAQAMWDIRRILSWVRGQGGSRIGVHGLSLGGYNTALLACLDDDLACAMPGIPATDFSRLVWRHGPRLQIRYAEAQGLLQDEVTETTRVVSPLALEPRVPKERRYIFGGVADQLVPADQVRDLWHHWDRPRIEWYQGGHVSFRLHRPVTRMLDEALRECELVGPYRADASSR